MICSQCGHDNRERVDFCSNCGAFLDWEEDEEQRERTTEADHGAQTPGGSAPPTDDTVPLRGERSADKAASSRKDRAPELLHSTDRGSSSTEQGGSSAENRVALSASIVESELKVEPEGQVTCEVRVRNTGTVVDQYHLEVLGPSATWATVEPQTINAYPRKAEGVARVTFNPPRSPDVPAGRTPFQVRLTSEEDPSVFAVVQGTVELGVFHEPEADLVPQVSSDKRTATYTLTLSNKGNSPLSVEITAGDPNQQLKVEVTPSGLTVQAGQQATAKIGVSARNWLWLGSAKPHQLEVTIGSDDIEPIELTCRFEQIPLIPKWAPRAAAVLLPLLVGLVAVRAIAGDSGPQLVTIPNVVNLDYAAASSQILELGLVVERTDEATDQAPEGKVFATDPPAGEQVEPNSAVMLMVSSGPGDVEVPDVVGSELEAARLTLQGADLLLGQVEEEPSQDVAAGVVLSQTPNAGATLEPEAEVDVVVSSGVPLVNVPNLVGLTRDEALSQLGGTLSSNVEETCDSDSEHDVVLDQDPNAGTKLPEGGTVTLVVNKMLQVPDQVGKTQSTATTELQKEGFDVEVEPEPEPSPPPEPSPSPEPEPEPEPSPSPEPHVTPHTDGGLLDDLEVEQDQSPQPEQPSSWRLAGFVPDFPLGDATPGPTKIVSAQAPVGDATPGPTKIVYAQAPEFACSGDTITIWVY